MVVLVLMMHEEKTNNSEAHMFKDVLDALLEDEIDIFSVISDSTYHGGNK